MIILLFVTLCFTVNTYSQIKINATVYSESVDTLIKVNIWLPNGYWENLDLYYPVIFYLHGAGGDQTEGLIFANHYYQTHNSGPYADSVPASIIISPDGGCEPYLGSFWVNSTLYGNYEDFIVSDLINFLETEFRVMNTRDFRYITGYSMGGFGSAYLALKNPDIFSVCVPQSAAHLCRPDTLMNLWLSEMLEENGGYNFQYNTGNTTQLYFTSSGAFAPNLDILPNQFEPLYDTLGNFIDTVWTKWEKFNCSNIVREQTEANPVNFFLLCGTIDEYLCYPPYLLFADSLNKYGINHKSIYNEYEHGEVDFEGLEIVWNWIDSMSLEAYKHLGIDNSVNQTQNFTVFPNPFKDEINISDVNIHNQPLSIKLRNIFNKLIIEFKPENYNVVNGNICLYTSYLIPGNYIIEINTGSKIVAKKIIKIE